MPTNKQRRQAAQRHLQRQLERRAAQARRRRRNLLVIITLAAVAAVVIAGAVIGGLGASKKTPSAASSNSPVSPTGSAAPSSSTAPSSSAAPSSTAPTTNPDGTIACDYAPASGPNLKDVGTPPNPDKTPTQGTVALKMNTNQGVIPLTLDRSKAPCAAASFAYLAGKGFFDPSTCHREVNQPNFGVLQCGDPTGTGQGGPTYTFREEATPQTKYPRGTIAMANTGQPNSTGSQFFLCFTDTDLPPNYSAVGTVDAAGLTVLDKIAAAGNDGSFDPSPGGGKPKVPVDVSSIDVVS